MVLWKESQEIQTLLKFSQSHKLNMITPCHYELGIRMSGDIVNDSKNNEKWKNDSDFIKENITIMHEYSGSKSHIFQN